VLDARWFGVPQRRRRVFIIGRARGAGGCPVSLLFEQPGLPGHPPEGGAAGEDVAGSLTGGTERRGWRIGADEAAGRQLVAAPDLAYAVNTSAERFDGPVETFVTGPLTANRGPHGHEGFAGNGGVESGHVVAVDLQNTLLGDGETIGTLDTTRPSRGGGQAVAFSLHADALGRTGEAVTPSADAEGRVRLRDPGLGVVEGESYTLAATAAHAVAFGAIGFDQLQDPVSLTEGSPALGQNEKAVQTGAAVRRLTPTECERLQAFEDGHTCLCGVEPYSTASCRCPDGPRYAALGNAVTTSVVHWLGERLLAVHSSTSAQPGAE
jgi:DNA (cytosine-5)-methyltransferase 1